MESKAKDDLVSYFIEEMEIYGKSPSTLNEYKRVLKDYTEFLDKKLDEANRRDCMFYIKELRTRDLASSSIATYASYIHRFYSYLEKAEEFNLNSNPMSLVMEEMEEKIDKNPRRRDLSVKEVSNFVKNINQPRDKCILFVLFKTGIRAGELANLDIDHISISPKEDKKFGLGGEVSEPSSIFISSDINGNKRVRDTLIPMDDELKSQLQRWIYIRPKNTKYLFPSYSSGRLSSGSISNMMKKYTQKIGWWNTKNDLTKNVTPHYCRHFFTTYLRDSSGDDSLVKYLRGDSGSEILETYTHQWGDRVREKYEKHIYKLL